MSKQSQNVSTGPQSVWLMKEDVLHFLQLQLVVVTCFKMNILFLPCK